VRLASQFGDGLFQAGLAWLVLLSPERQHTPAAVASAAALILLPFSVVGPFTGVILDRRSRRQVLAYGQTGRVILVITLALAADSTQPGALAYTLGIAALGLNRFLLAALSAGLPHVVPRELLVTANAVAPTAGTIATLVGAGVGGVVLSIEGAGSRTVLLLASGAFGCAGLLALRLSRSALGPGPIPTGSDVHADLRQVARDFADGMRHLRSRAAAWWALVAFGSYRFWYGLWTVQVAMLTLGATTYDLSAAATVATVSAIGFVGAAVVTPLGRRRIPDRPWAVASLLLAGVAVASTAVARDVAALAGAGFVLGLVAQSLKICTDTTLQRHVADSHLGRAFAVYDVAFNAAFVAAAVLAVFLVPASGQTSLAPLLAAAGLALTAAAYGRRSAA